MAVGVTVNYNNQPLSLISLYNPPENRVSTNEWKNLFNSIPKPCIIAGDYNVHHQVFGSGLTDCKGRDLLAALEESYLVFLNDGSPTLLNSISQVHNSAVDITICSPDIAADFCWQVLGDTLGSNHFPILITCHNSLNAIDKKPSRKWNVQKADWDKYQEVLNYSSENNNFLDHLSKYDNIVNNINKAAQISIPIKRNNHKKIKPINIWWNKECEEITVKRKSALRQFKINPSLQNYCLCKNLSAQAKKIIKQAKRSSWEQFCGNLNRNTRIKEIWNNIKVLNNKHVNQPPVTDGDWSEDVLNKICPSFVQNNLEGGSTCNDNADFFSNKFSISELESVMKRNANTAPGKDDIQYIMLSNLPPSIKLSLLDVFNEMWAKGDFPIAWKEYAVVPILKPNKTPNQSSSYRPIALSSCVLKTFERLVKNKLEWFLEHNNLLPKFQFGFRKGRSVYDCHTQLITDIQLAFTQNNFVLALFLDISAAYDNVDWSILKIKMSQLNLPKIFINNVLSLYSERKIYLKINNEYNHAPKTAKKGLPQGGILSPLLFAIYLYDLGAMLPDNVRIVQYADDICIYCVDKSVTRCESIMDNAVQKINKYMTGVGLTISVNKSVSCIFSRHRGALADNITLDGDQFPLTDQVNFLGLTLDKKLNWVSHINSLIKKCEKYVNVLRSISGKKNGADQAIALLYYKATIRAVIDFGSIFYGQACKSKLKELDRLQNKCIRTCIGYLNSTPVDVMLGEVGEPPLALRRQMLSDRYLVRLMTTDSPLYTNTCVLATQVLTSSYWQKKVPPLLVNSFTDLASLNCHIYSSKISPCFSTDYYNLVQQLTVQYLPDTKHLPPHISNSVFNDFNNKHSDLYKIFTDGSKQGNSTGAAFYDPQNKSFSKFKLPQLCSVYNSELIAIREALKYCRNLINKNVGIYSDSKSSLEKLSNISIKNLSYLVIDILEIINELKFKGINVTFFWVRSHCGIRDNEIVDQLAKAATTDGVELDYRLTVEDVTSVIRERVRAEWQGMYESSDKGRFYKGFVKEVDVGKPWFAKVGLMGRRAVTSMSRLRANHYVCGQYLHMINRREHGMCVRCDVVESPEHLIMECAKYENNRHHLMNELYNLMTVPFNYVSIISSKNICVLEALLRFLESTNI